MPTPMKPEQRPVLVNAKCKPISRDALNTIWRTMMLGAIKAGVITQQRFGVPRPQTPWHHRHQGRQGRNERSR
jgi:hypothetical protein